MLQVEKGAGRGLAQMESRKVQTLNNRRGLVKRKHAQVISMPPTDPRYTYPTHVHGHLYFVVPSCLPVDGESR